MTDEENYRPAWGKRDPLEVEAKRFSMGLPSPMQIQDKDLIEFDGSEYRVRLYPSARNRIQVEVDLIEGGCTIGIFSRAYADNDPERIEEATFDCIQDIVELCK